METELHKLDPLQAAHEILTDSSKRGDVFRKTFAKCTSDKQRVKLVLLTYYKNVELDFQIDASQIKSSERAVSLREDGNDKYKKKLFGQAIKCYNQSLAFAPTGSGAGPEAALALANRSAVLYHLKKFDACLQDIQRAINSGYPATDHYKLFERRAKCFSGLDKPEDARKAFMDAKKAVSNSAMVGKDKKIWLKRIDVELSKCQPIPTTHQNGHVKDEKNGEDPYRDIGQKIRKEIKKQLESQRFKIIGLELGVSETKGRYLAAARDIKIGEAMIYEKAASCVPNTKVYCQYCYHCLALLLNPIPCPACTQVFYCSDNCLDLSLRTYHVDECPVLFEFDKNTHTELLPSIPQMALRNLLTLSANDLDCVDNLGKITNNISDVSLLSLLSHHNERTIDRQLMFTTVAIRGALTLKGGTFWNKIRFKRKEPEQDTIVLFATFLLHFLGATVCNSFQVPCYELPDDNDFRHADLQYAGVSLCPVIDMANHSCNPEADVEFHFNYCIIRATKNIKKGEEVHIEYGPNYIEGAKPARQIELQTKFFFNCQCEACVYDWPLVEDIDDRQPRFRCEVCRVEITKPAAKDGTLDCLCCKHQQNMYTICETLAESHKAYDHVMKNTTRVGIEMVISVLEQHVTLMDYWICLPWKDYAKCQATLKQIYRCIGNHCYGKDKMWT